MFRDFPRRTIGERVFIRRYVRVVDITTFVGFYSFCRNRRAFLAYQGANCRYVREFFCRPGVLSVIVSLRASGALIWEGLARLKRLIASYCVLLPRLLHRRAVIYYGDLRQYNCRRVYEQDGRVFHCLLPRIPFQLVDVMDKEDDSHSSIVASSSYLGSFYNRDFHCILCFVAREINASATIANFLPNDRYDSDSDQVDHVIVYQVHFRRSSVLRLRRVRLTTVDHDHDPRLPLPHATIKSGRGSVLERFLTSIVFVNKLVGLVGLSPTNVGILQVAFRRVVRRDEVINVRVIRS